jgi:hypothetical protein
MNIVCYLLLQDIVISDFSSFFTSSWTSPITSVEVGNLVTM